jgi:formylglycine-generating enzyme required for sulfatase activity
LLARRAVELAAELSPEERAGIRDSLAWALFANGRFDEAVAEEEQALEEAAADKKQEFEGYLAKLKEKIEAEIDPEKEGEREKHVSGITARIAALEAELSTRPEWLFADAQDKWWHNQLEKLVNGLKAFSNEKTGLFSDGTSAEHGWGIARRADFARTIAERSVSGGPASVKWAEAITSIANAAECPRYGGLRITPQLGMLPIGPDPASGLWEFAHLQTGEPAERGPDGKLILKEETGLVFVLLPGGTYRMGAQAEDPAGDNYDPQAGSNEGPVHAVTLSPFFLSKYEMTQGQWKTFVGSNPSYYAAGGSSAKTRITLRHPVEQVSWTTCELELGRLGLELPSEAQWEYACRAGTSTAWSPGSTLESLRGHANIADEGSADAYQKGWNFEPGFADGWDVHCPVGSLSPNAFGLHEMHGNVWEWCLDGYQGAFYREGPQKDPVSDPSGSSNRVDRGGGFNNPASYARSATRARDAPSYADDNLGARPARRISP